MNFSYCKFYEGLKGIPLTPRKPGRDTFRVPSHERQRSRGQERSQIRRARGADKCSNVDCGGDGESACRSIAARFGVTGVTGRFAKRLPLKVTSPTPVREPSKKVMTA